MSLRAALQFIVAVRDRPELAHRIEALGLDATLEDVVRVGAESGFDFTTVELRDAHQHDWGMRWVRYAVPPDSGK